MIRSRKIFIVAFALIALFVFAGTNASALDTPIGETSVDLDGARENVRTGETNLANLITDAMRSTSGAAIAVTNGGGIRDSVSEGEITLEDILDIHPFENVVVTIELTGAEIVEALEHGVSQHPDDWGGFMQVSGLEYTFDPSEDPGNRIVEVLYAGVPINEDATFLVATNDFLSSGGDEYDMLEKDTVEEFDTLDNVIIDYVMDYSPVSPEVTGRITEM